MCEGICNKVCGLTVKYQASVSFSFFAIYKYISIEYGGGYESGVLAVFELTSVKRVVFLSTPDKKSWLSGRLAPAFSVL